MGWHPSYGGMSEMPAQLRHVLDYPVKPGNDGVMQQRKAVRRMGLHPSYNSTVTMLGQISKTDSARSWMPMNGRKPRKMSVSEMCGGATDFR